MNLTAAARLRENVAKMANRRYSNGFQSTGKSMAKLGSSKADCLDGEIVKLPAVRKDAG
jgi:hypothetical protein